MRRAVTACPQPSPGVVGMARAWVTVVLLSGVCAACSAGTVGPPPAPPVDWHAFDVHRPKPATTTPTAKERALAEGYALALASPGEAQLASRLDDDAHFAFPGMADARGREQVVKAHELLFGPFDERRVTTTRVWHTDSIQTLEWVLTGVHVRTWMGVAA